MGGTAHASGKRCRVPLQTMALTAPVVCQLKVSRLPAGMSSTSTLKDRMASSTAGGAWVAVVGGGEGGV